MRIASLLPSATEMVCAVGAQDELVGVSHECDHPPGVEQLPTLTRTRQEMPRASGEIDRTVREILRDTLSVYEIEVDRLRDAAPDVIVTQDLCDVCAVSLGDVQKALVELARQDVELVSCTPTRLGDVWEDIRRVGRAVGHADEGERAATELEARTVELGKRAAELGRRPTVLSIEWLDPVMIGGTWMPELVELAGGTPLVTTPGQHAPTLGLAELEALDPDVVLIKPCGFELERTQSELELLRSGLPWERWTAVKERRVFIADGNAFFNRPGPRLVESLEILAACIHPEAFSEFAERHAESVLRVSPELVLKPLAH